MLVNTCGTCKWDHELAWCCCKHTIQVEIPFLFQLSWLIVCAFSFYLFWKWCNTADATVRDVILIANMWLDIVHFVSVYIGTFYAPFCTLCSYTNAIHNDYAYNLSQYIVYASLVACFVTEAVGLSCRLMTHLSLSSTWTIIVGLTLTSLTSWLRPWGGTPPWPSYRWPMFASLKITLRFVCWYALALSLAYSFTI